VAHAARLTSIGVADDAELAAQVQAGTVDDWDAVAAVVWADVLDKLRVANPDHLLPTDR
jgi:hypothetical protein